MNEAWVTAIGEYMMAFAWMERSVNNTLRLWEAHDAPQPFKHVPLKVRQKRLRTYAATKKIGPTARKVLFDNLDELMTLVKVRNLIAHNLVDLDLEDFLDSNINDDVPPSIRHIESDQQLKLPQLNELLVRAKALQEALYEHDTILRMWETKLIDADHEEVLIVGHPILQKAGGDATGRHSQHVRSGSHLISSKSQSFRSSTPIAYPLGSRHAQ